MRERTVRDSLLEDYCLARGIPFEPARFHVTDAELLAWVNEDAATDDSHPSHLKLVEAS